jgi:hypothetical protein
MLSVIILNVVILNVVVPWQALLAESNICKKG